MAPTVATRHYRAAVLSNGRNGEGDPYYTDGEIWVARLVDAGQETEKLAEMQPAPALIQMKDAVFSWRSIRQ